MTLPTHIILGLVVGKITGNYTLAIASSVLIDVDHLQSYIKNRVIFNPKLFWKTITDKNDPYGDQRGYLHNFFVFFVSSIILFLFFGYIIIPFIAGWFGHIFLDALDNSDYWPFFPYKWLNLKGPILYASYQEVIFFVLLGGIYFMFL